MKKLKRDEKLAKINETRKKAWVWRIALSQKMAISVKIFVILRFYVKLFVYFIKVKSRVELTWFHVKKKIKFGSVL
jgi:hypothetical protein